MYGFIVKLRLFLTSYALLFVALVCRFENKLLLSICIGLAVIGMADAINLLFRVPHRLAKTPVTFERVNDSGSDVSGYMASYLLPFITVAQPTIRDIIGYLVFIFVAGLIYTRSNMMQVNPSFYLLGFKVCRVESSGWVGYVIATKAVRAHQSYQAVKLGGNVMIIT